MQQSHTLPSRTSRHTNQNLAKSVSALPQDKFNFFLPSLRYFNFFATHNRHKNSWAETAKTFTDTDLTMTEDRRPACKRRLTQLRVTWLIEHSTSHQLLWCIDSSVLRNPPERQAKNHYKK